MTGNSAQLDLLDFSPIPSACLHHISTAITTIDRHAIVMFYIDKTILRYWRLMDRLSPVIRLDRPPFRLIRKFVSWKLRTFRQIEYEIGGIEKIAAEYEQCLVNAPQGRVVIPSSTSR